MTNEKMCKYYKPKQVREILNISDSQLYRWTREEKISHIRTHTGRFLYDLDSYLKPKIADKFEDGREKICYCRVSTRSQKHDLDRQEEFFRKKYPNHRIISDFGSGLNFKRNGLKTILDKAIEGRISEIVLTHKDRLVRFGFDLIERLVHDYSRGKIVVLDQETTSPQEELVNDLISIITVFSSRIYGLRAHSIKRKIRENTANARAEERGIDEGDGSGESEASRTEGVVSKEEASSLRNEGSFEEPSNRA